MRTTTLSIPELGLIAMTRAMLGMGGALLLAERLGPEQRRAIGWTLVGVGALTTVPLVLIAASNPSAPLRAQGPRPELEGQPAAAPI